MRFFSTRRVVSGSLLGGVLLAAVSSGTGAAGAATVPTSVPTITTSTPGTASNISVGVDTNYGWYSTIGYAAPDLAQLAKNGITNIRQDFRWDLTQPQRNVWNWGRLDTIMTQAAVNHISVLPILDYTPSWADGGQSPYQPPTNLGDFATYGAAVVARYGPNGSFWSANPTLVPDPITAVEAWNEPWYYGTWANPDPNGYAQMVRLLANAVRSTSPQVKIAVCEDAYYQHTQSGWTTRWVGALTQSFPDMAQYVDIASVHVYGVGNLDPSPAYVPALSIITQALSADGVNVPIWITETGADAQAISATQFAAPPNTIVPLAWTVQGNDFTNALDTLNSIAVANNVTRVYFFSYGRAASDTAWSGSGSGLLLQGPTGSPRGGALALFAWAAAHSLPQ